MNRRHIFGLSVTIAVGLALITSDAIAQQKSMKEQIVGTWAIVSNDNISPDGSKRQPFGPKPKGYMVLSANGQYVQILTNPDRQKFKADNRLQGTPEEN